MEFNIIEFGKQFHNSITQLTKEQLEDCIRILFASKTPGYPKEILDEDWIAQAILKRVDNMQGEFYQYKLSPWSAIFISFLFQNIGSSVMFLAYLQYWLHDHPQYISREFTPDFLCTYVIPMGVPNEMSLQRLWNSQKVNRTPDNALDWFSFYQDIII